MEGKSLMPKSNKYQEKMKAWPELFQFSKKIKLTDSDLSLFTFSAEEKENSTLLLIHGLGDEADTWRHVFLPLAEKYHVIALDLPGFGRSDKPNLKYTPPFMMDSVIKLMNTLRIQKTILMGSSLGGILSHQIAIDHPDRVEGLILIGGALLHSETMADWRVRLMSLPLIGEWFYTHLRKDPDAAYDSIRNVYYNLDQMTEKDRDFLYERVNKRVWSNGQRRAYFSTLRELASWMRKNRRKVDTQLKSLDIPTLAIRGEYDQLYSQNNLDHLKKIQPNINTGMIENAGHLPHQEKPEEFLRVVSVWLKGLA